MCGRSATQREHWTYLVAKITIIHHNVATCVHMADMLNSSRDNLLELEPTFALVLKLTVGTVLTVAEGSDTAEIATRPVYFNSPRLNFFAQLHSIFITPRGQLCIILPILLRFLPIILELFSILWPTYYSQNYSRIISASLLETLERFSCARPRFWPSQSDYCGHVQQRLACRN